MSLLTAVVSPATSTVAVPAILIVIAVIGFLSQPVATGLNAFLQSRREKAAAQREEERRLAAEEVKTAAAQATADNLLAQLQAKKDGAIAQRQAAEASTALFDAALKLAETQKATDGKIDELKLVGDATHTLVNKKFTDSLRTIANLSRALARAFPDNTQLELAAKTAETLAEDAEAAQAAGTGAIPPGTISKQASGQATP
jgi:type II secretory pathway pseudopilin PulG